MQIYCGISYISLVILSFPFVLQDDIHMKTNLLHLYPYYTCLFAGWIWPSSCTNISFHESVWLQVRSLTLWCAWFWQHFPLLLNESRVLSVATTSPNYLPILICNNLINIRSFCKSFPSLKVQSFITKYSRFLHLIIIFMTCLPFNKKKYFFFDNLSNQI